MATKKKAAPKTTKPAQPHGKIIMSFDAKVLWNQEHQNDNHQRVMNQTKLYADVEGFGVLIELATKEKQFETGRTYNITIKENE